MLSNMKQTKSFRIISGLVLLGLLTPFAVFFQPAAGAGPERTASLATKAKQERAGANRVSGAPGVEPANAVTAAPQSALPASGDPAQPAWTGKPSSQARAAGSANTGNSGYRGGSYQNDLYLLARVINAEARGESLQGQVAVGAVLLNRLNNPKFPKSLNKIIFKQGEFCTVRDGQIWLNPSPQALKAARLAMSGWDPTGGAVYFYNPAKTSSKWIWSRPVTTKIGQHIFAAA